MSVSTKNPVKVNGNGFNSTKMTVEIDFCVIRLDSISKRLNFLADILDTGKNGSGFKLPRSTPEALDHFFAEIGIELEKLVSKIDSLSNSTSG